MGCEWVQRSAEKAVNKCETYNLSGLVNIIVCDFHKTPFSDRSFDTIVDTFGLECSYDIEKALDEMIRVTKPGGKILLLERGLGLWFHDNFLLF